MKLLTYEQMMQQPKGTIYQVYRPHFLDEPEVFGGSMEFDFVRASLLPDPITFDFFGPRSDLKEKWKIEGECDPIIIYPSGFGRDGLFDKDRTFLVWEKADREKLAAWLLDPDLCMKEQNDDPHALISSADFVE